MGKEEDNYANTYTDNIMKSSNDSMLILITTFSSHPDVEEVFYALCVKAGVIMKYITRPVSMYQRHA